VRENCALGHRIKNKIFTEYMPEMKSQFMFSRLKINSALAESLSRPGTIRAIAENANY